MTTSSPIARIHGSADTPSERTGIKLRTPRGGWFLINRTRFFRICDVWYQSGYDAGLRAAQEATLEKANR